LERAGEGGQFDEVATLPEMLEAVKDEKADLAISAISITSQREEAFDFSQPIFDSGMQILVRPSGDASGLSLSGTWRAATSAPVLDLLAVLAALVVILAHIVWFFDRWHEEQHKPYFPGIVRATYWSIGAAGGQQPFAPHSAVARFLGALAVFTSTIVVAYFTAAVTSAMTVNQLESDISGPADLPGRKVATFVGSTSAGYLRQLRIDAKEFSTIAEACGSLISHETDAVVYDSPVLLNYVDNDGKGLAVATGGVFRHEAYGVLFPSASPLRKPLDEALLKLRESGAYDEICRKWFGAVASAAR
jgi:polar amino acid transport system substrate-binding protein